MAGQQFQYDDSGNTFFYFLTSFVGLIVIPATYYLWPRDQHAEVKNILLKHFWKIILLAGWALFLFLAYKVSKTDREYQEYNPYEVLHLDPVSNIQCHILKFLYANDLKKFLNFCINFVFLLETSLTDEELPMSKYEVILCNYFDTSLWLTLCCSYEMFQGSWWYRSIRYSGDQILIRTTQIYTYFVYKTRNMDMKRLIMVLAGASEFDPQYNKDATSRPADNVQIPQLIREIGGINLKKNEPPLTCPYSLKARVLLLTHLARMKVPDTLEEGKFPVKASLTENILDSSINLVCSITFLSKREFRAPSLGSLENCMKLSQMTVQGLQQFKSPLLQLPHIEEDNLRRVSNHKKYKIKSIQDLVSLKGSDRRNLLHFLEDKKYDEVMAVLGSFPYVTMDIKPQVLDDEDSNNITVGSLVTVLVTLTRQTMAEVFEKEQSICSAEEQPAEDGQGDSNKVKSKGWQQKNKGTKKASKSKKKKPLKKKPVPPSLQPPKQQKQKQANGVEVVVKEEEEEVSDKGSESEEEETNRDSQSEKDDGSDRESDREQDEKQNKDDEAEWQELQQSIQRKERALLETKSKITHPVYILKHPHGGWWWKYTKIAISVLQVELKFPAPGKPGNYQYTVYLRSDSYMGLDQIKPLKLEVHEAKPVPENHPQWDTAIEGDEDQEDSEGFEDSFEEEEEEEEDDD
uniref:SEC63 homolog, protein translocation regulator n=1 Tax=Pavo cristatus TaxID=9049 RepID=A0A8C9FW76_PAVCR